MKLKSFNTYNKTLFHAFLVSVIRSNWGRRNVNINIKKTGGFMFFKWYYQYMSCERGYTGTLSHTPCHTHRLPRCCDRSLYQGHSHGDFPHIHPHLVHTLCSLQNMYIQWHVYAQNVCTEQWYKLCTSKTSSTTYKHTKYRCYVTHHLTLWCNEMRHSNLYLLI